jgi:hypothetical protein
MKMIYKLALFAYALAQSLNCGSSDDVSSFTTTPLSVVGCIYAHNNARISKGLGGMLYNCFVR